MEKSDRHDDHQVRDPDERSSPEEVARDRVEGPADESTSPEQLLLTGESLEEKEGEELEAGETPRSDFEGSEAPDADADQRLRTYSVPGTILEELDEFAAVSGRDRSKVVEDALTEYFEAHRQDLEQVLQKD